LNIHFSVVTNNKFISNPSFYTKEGFWSKFSCSIEFNSALTEIRELQKPFKFNDIEVLANAIANKAEVSVPESRPGNKL